MLSAPDKAHTMTNRQIAAVLEEVAKLLEMQGANPFRVAAYRAGAETIRSLPYPVTELAEEEGIDGLVALPKIGRSLGHAIEQLGHSGQLPLLKRLKGENIAERMFATVADIGPGLAHRIHEELQIETLAELQVAANDGRLGRVRGMGPKRVRAVRESLAGRFRQQKPLRTGDSGLMKLGPAPIPELLSIDEEYRRLARQDKLPRIAPQRMNPTNAAWLPILHTEREDRHYTALYSNTVRAHEFGATHDWVIIYRDDQDSHDRWTVITSGYGVLRGKRIVRGREAECKTYYAEKGAL